MLSPSRVAPHESLTLPPLGPSVSFSHTDDHAGSYSTSGPGMRKRKSNLQKKREDQVYQSHVCSMVEFTKEHFKRKECIHFVLSPKSEPSKPVCHCGASLEQHYKHTSGTEVFFQKGFRSIENDLDTGVKGSATWDKTKHIQELETNAFGKIDFNTEGSGARKPAKYIRLADNSDIDQVIKLMCDYWDMDKPFEPSLIITVVGGAKNFKLEGNLKDVFNNGLVQAAQTTNAWIITSGFNIGVMKAVGEAVAEGQKYNFREGFHMSHTLRCVGITPWGYTENNKELADSNNELRQYRVNNNIRHGHPVSLNGNYTHFLLVDDGFRNKYQGTSEFRARLEKALREEKNKHVVLVVVEGGNDAIDDTASSLKQNIPVVVCEGTGRAADILAFAYKHVKSSQGEERKYLDEEDSKELAHKLDDAYGKTWQDRGTLVENLQKYIKIVVDCCQNPDLMTIFDMNKSESLDHAILSALLKGDFAKNNEQVAQQLELALTWNRSDVARDKIFNRDIAWSAGELDKIMTRAILENKVDFMRLLLNNGLVMKEYLTAPRLRKLYEQLLEKAPSHIKLAAGLKEKAPLSLMNIDKLLRTLVGCHIDDMYVDDDVDEEYLPDNAYQELFLMAVLTDKIDIAKFLWERCDCPVICAIVGTKIFHALQYRVEHINHDLSEKYQKNKRLLEQWAVQVIEEAHRTDHIHTQHILRREYEKWGNQNCMEVAASAVGQEFLSTVACQSEINRRWKKEITSPLWKVIIALLCPPLIFCFISFSKNDDDDSKNAYRRKFGSFFGSPMVKFIGALVMYLFFLIFYSYVILFGMEIGTIGVAEIILLIWIFTLTIEEVREMFFLTKATGFKARLKAWWNFSVFNRMDLLMMCIAVIGVGIRIKAVAFVSDDDRYTWFKRAKDVYTVNCVAFFIRGFGFYSASSYLGPKLVMIAKMLEELMQFILILLVIMIAYGVAIEALMYPNRQPYSLIFRDILYYPSWQIYGDIYIEYLQGRGCNGNSTSIQADGNLCPEFNWLVPTLTAGFLLIGNVLLINLLIAIFTFVFQEIQGNSIQLWKFGMYFLTVEFEVKPYISPPLVIIEFLCRLLVKLIRGEYCQDSKNSIQYQDRELEFLSIFEKEMQKSVLSSTHKEKVAMSLENKVAQMTQRVTDITTRLDEISKKQGDLQKSLCAPLSRPATANTWNLVNAGTAKSIDKQVIPETSITADENLNSFEDNPKTIEKSAGAMVSELDGEFLRERSQSRRKKRKKNHRPANVDEMNVNEAFGSELSQRLSQLEETNTTTQRTLNNIEIMLRSAAFQRTANPPYRPF